VTYLLTIINVIY